MSIGETRVRIDFNVGGDDHVTSVKQTTADMINFLNTLDPFRDKDATCEDFLSDSVEKSRLITIAQQKYEEAAMWAVKAITA